MTGHVKIFIVNYLKIHIFAKVLQKCVLLMQQKYNKKNIFNFYRYTYNAWGARLKLSMSAIWPMGFVCYPHDWYSKYTIPIENQLLIADL